MANMQVKTIKAKVQLERSILFIYEAVDQADKHVFNKYIPLNASFTTEFKKDLLNGVMVLDGTARQLGKMEIRWIKASVRPSLILPGKIVEPMKWQWIPYTPQIVVQLRAYHCLRAQSCWWWKAPIKNGTTLIASPEEPSWGVNRQWEPKSWPTFPNLTITGGCNMNNWNTGLRLWEGRNSV